ncbi:hypothetical protein L249_8788 [Ophiocordyceps polyrhachis-furcata BCC 54312]|uniref:Major facilitator superfamily (MFS) profile domain-containing protein n=1 Tax=Ophiocordyceps polyrhachis-furcata BCC 54312 TaxID=1330021 RepID=A0A367L2A4_9HYPO|nr:hypothetical protein L249_8788 [Ophiocordyceps polyrhachis-furcata BCC 54312]
MEETTPLLGRQLAAPSRSTVLLLSLVIFSLSCFSSVSSVPLNRLLEHRLCRQYGAHHARLSFFDERVCKADVVQSQLAHINGILDTLEAVVGLLVAFPYGALSDKVGRKPVILLSIAGFALGSAWTALILARDQATIQTILLAPAFFLIGGGRHVTYSTVFSAVSDVTTEKTRASAFVTISLGSFMGGVVGPVVSSGLMQVTSPWLPYLMSFAMVLLGAALLMLVPETLPPRKKNPQDDYDDDDDDDDTSILFSYLTRLRASLSMLRKPELALVLVAFLAPVPMSTAANQFFVQYVSKRFFWSMADAGYLQSVRGAVNVVLLLVVLPCLGNSKALLSRASSSSSPAAKDRYLAQLSAVALTLGCLLMAGESMPLVVAGFVVNTLGNGLAPLCRSLAAHLVAAHEQAGLQTLIAIVEASSSLFAGPALASALSAGMRRGGVWMGLPYFGLAAFLFFVTLPLLVPMRTRPRRKLKSGGGIIEP